jgi:tetratricopeptide (TPR) repeat protein
MTTTRKPGTSSEARIKELKGALVRDPLNVNLRLQLATALESSGKGKESLKCLAESVEKARRNLGVAHCTYAGMLMKSGKPDDALQNYDLSIELDPSNASFYLSNKAHALTQLGLSDKAKAIYEQILQQKNTTKETQRIVIKNLGQIRKR